MGTYNTTYVGIYLEIPFLQGTVKETFYVHPETGKKQKARFDAQTGRENVKKTEERIEYITPHSYIEDVKNAGMSCGDKFFTPAYTNGGKRIQTFVLNGKSKYSYTDDDLFNLDLSKMDIPKLIEEFNVDYKAYLDYYEQEYEVVNVLYGIVNYAH